MMKCFFGLDLHLPAGHIGKRPMAYISASYVLISI